MPLLVGADLAWRLERNNSALSLIEAKHGVLHLRKVVPAIIGESDIFACIADWQPTGIAIDAPLVVKNDQGMRACERALNQVYRAKYAGCHPTNLNLYPQQEISQLSKRLERHGYHHLAKEYWQIECYPHPTLIEWFQLDQRLAYKRGSVAERRDGQLQLAMLLGRWVAKGKLVLDESVEYLFEPSRIASLRGNSLKINEDALDAVICGLIAGCYYYQTPHRCFGTVEAGYIWVPKESL
jgi:predicted RNase H-like nuclease